MILKVVGENTYVRFIAMQIGYYILVTDKSQATRFESAGAALLKAHLWVNEKVEVEP